MKEKNLRENHPQITGRELFWSVKKIADTLDIKTELKNEAGIYNEISSGAAMEGKTLAQLIEAKNELQKNEVPEGFNKDYQDAKLALTTWIRALEDIKKRL